MKPLNAIHSSRPSSLKPVVTPPSPGNRCPGGWSRRIIVAFILAAAASLAPAQVPMVNSDFSSDVAVATGTSLNNRGLGVNDLGKWVVNAAVTDTRTWHRPTSVVGPSGATEGIALYQDISTGANTSQDTRAIMQVVTNTAAASGVLTLSFDYLLNDSDTLNNHTLKFRVEVFGIHPGGFNTGAFDLAVPNVSGSVVADDNYGPGPVDLLLIETNFTKTTHATVTGATWRKASFAVDLAQGEAPFYESIGFRFTASNGGLAAAATTTQIGLDNVVFASGPPVAVPDSFSVEAGTTNNVLPVLANDTGGPLNLISVSAPANGTAAMAGGVIHYTPSAGYVGADAFTYTLAGGSSAEVLITVTPVDTSLSYQVLTGSSSNTLDVLRKSPPGATLVSLTAPAHGAALIAGTNVHYTPNPGYSGPDAFDLTTSADTFTINLDVRVRPNFVFILSDDQGWTSMEVEADKNLPGSKSDYHITPNLRRLAEEGLRFSRGYSAHPNCSPSRYSNLTGKTVVRHGLTDIVDRNNTPTPNTTERMISPGKKVVAIQSSDVTLPELLKTLPGGYATAHWGKWHLNGNGPANHGFDESDGATGNGAGDNAPAPMNSDPKLAYSITGRGIDFMTRKVASGTPFYCQISHYAVHDAIRYSQAGWDAYAGKPAGTRHYNRGYAAMHTDLDTTIGQVLEAMDKLGIRHSTYVIFQSDNGAVQSYSPLQNSPLRRGKPELWEGGVRVPTLFRGPGIKANSQCDLTMMGVDILPTLWQWAGGSPGALPTPIDGGSLVPAITAISAGAAPPPIVRPGELVHYSPHYVIATYKDQRPSLAIHDGDYKLVIEFEKTTFDESFSLFHLDAQLGENTDLSETELAIRWRLWVRARDYLKQVNPLFAVPHPVNWPGADGIDDGDVDNDGIPDLVELRELLTVAFNGSSDPDQDGVSTAAEIAAGTDPLVPNAYLIQTITQVAPGQLQFAWNATPGQAFAVESSTNLVHWAPAQTVTAGDVFYGNVTVVVTEPNEFFRVRKL